MIIKNLEGPEHPFHYAHFMGGLFDLGAVAVASNRGFLFRFLARDGPPHRVSIPPLGLLNAEQLHPAIIQNNVLHMTQ